MSNIIVINPFMQGGASGELWTPADITTALWLDASDTSTITATGGLVDQINDKSGNGRNFIGTTTTRPTTGASTLNGLNVLDFAGDYLTSASAASTWNFLHNAAGSSVFAVAKAGAASNPDDIYGLLGTNASSTGNHGVSIFYDDRSLSDRNDVIVNLISRGFFGAPTASSISANGVWAANSYQVVGVVSDPANATAASRQSVRLNGGANVADNVSTSTASSSDATFVLQIGSVGNSLFPLVGSIAEVVLLSGANESYRIAIEGYLAHKWGLSASLPSDHLFRSSAPGA